MRFGFPELLLGSLLTIAVLAMGALFVGGSTVVVADGGWLTKDAAGFFTSALFVVGILQLALFYWQLKLMRNGAADTAAAARAAQTSAEVAGRQSVVAQDTLKTMQDTAQRELRAYVSVAGVIRTKNPGDLEGGGFAVCVDVKNDGQTPAYDLLQWAEIAVQDFPLTSSLPIHCLENPTRGILPRDTKSLAFPAFNRALTTIEENAILANHTAIYVYGEIDYMDVFGKRHLTRFRFRCNGQGYPLGLFKPDGEGNYAD